MTETGYMKFISDHWHVITGIVLALWWMLVRVKRAIFRDYVTNAQMVDCKNEILYRIEKADRKNDHGHETILKVITDHLNK